MSNNNERGVLYIGDGRTDGVSLGTSTSDKISFFGKTPVSQQANIADVATTAITTAATSTTPFGFATSTQADNLLTIVHDLRTKFNTLIGDFEDLGTHAAS